MTTPNRIGMNKKALHSNTINNMSNEQFDMYVAQFMVNKKNSCMERGISFKLNFTSCKNLLKAKKCHYTGVTLVRGNSQSNDPNYLTIDRIDSSKPYEKGNVVACSLAANRLKNQVEKYNDLTMTQAMKLFKKVVDRGVN